jgi:hypothetical protein
MFFDRIVGVIEKIPLKAWILFAFFSRVIISITYQSYNHPDEWYQTIEFSNLIWGKKATYSPEIFWHMRNLLWPWILSFISRLSFFLSPTSIWLQISSIQLFNGLLDLFCLIAILDILKRFDVKQAKLWAIFFLSAHFLLKDSVRPSQEHISSILFYCTLAAFGREYWFLSGVLTSLVGATKYASGLLSAGLYLSFIIIFCMKNISVKNLMKIHLGILFGILIGGLPDAIYYGTFFESMWSYFYYNIYAGLMSKIFGEQSAIVHLKFLFSQWKIVHFSLFIIGLLVSIKFILSHFKKYLVLLIPTIVFIIGNLLLKHKEGRFVTQIEVALWLILAIGVSLTPLFQKKPHLTTRFIGILIIFNIIFSLINLSGDLNKPVLSYLKLPSLIETYPKNCAAIILKRPLGPFFFSQTTTQAFWLLGKKDDIQTAMNNNALVWFEQNRCQEGEKILVQTFKQDLTSFNCNKIDTWGSYWFQCPQSILGNFKKQVQRNIFIENFSNFPIPNLNTPPETMLSLQKEFEQKFNLSIGSMPDL